MIGHAALSMVGACMAALLVGGASGQAALVPMTEVFGVPVASYAELDPGAYDRRAGPALLAATPDLRIAALLAVDPPLSPTLRILTASEPEATVAPRAVEVLAEDLADDAVASALTQVVFDRRADGSWFVARARRALLCRRGDVTDRFVEGPCP